MDLETPPDQQEQQATVFAARLQPGKPRGRPFVKGQSGNPAGRPAMPRMPRAGALVAENMLAEYAALLTQKVINLALAGNLAALRICLDRIVPPRRDAPIPLHLTKEALAGPAGGEALAEAAASGDLAVGQAAALIKLLNAASNKGNAAHDGQTPQPDGEDRRPELLS